MEANPINRKQRWQPPEIEDVSEPFCGCRRKHMVPLADADPEVASQWYYKDNAGWGPEHFSHASTVRAWWECPFCLRIYKASVYNRTANKSACPYCASNRVCEDNALTVFNAKVAAEWHPARNGKRKVSDVMRASGKSAWWLCSTCQHEWQAAPADRTVSESGCPACYDKRMQYAREHPAERKRGHVVLGEKKKPSRSWYESGRYTFIPLSKSHPKIAKQWHPTANGTWTPADFAHGSEALAWWKCNKAKDHEWQSPIYSRTGKGRYHCPFCIGKRVAASNSLKTQYPLIAKQWHPTRNGKLKPADVTAHSGKKAWWQCRKAKDHVWETTIGLRANGSKCPFCSRVRPSKDNNLKARFPKIAAQLHPTKNGDLKAKDIAPYSSKHVWWVCKNGPDHIWQATPGNRTGRSSGCPFCTGKQVSVTNSLKILFPKIARLWHKTKNGDLLPNRVTAQSKKIGWWKCKASHVWNEPICKLVTRKGTCPRCSKKKNGRS